MNAIKLVIQDCSVTQVECKHLFQNKSSHGGGGRDRDNKAQISQL